jgi:hypothetical protein
MNRITEENYIEYCKANYNNIHCLNEEEFENDLKTLRYIKSFFRRYLGKNEVKIEILINHFIYLYNCFGESIVDICFFDFEDYYYPLLKTMFVYLEIMPNNISTDKFIYSEDITVDLEFYKKLRQSKHNY